MRTLSFAVLILAVAPLAPAHAQVVQDRYGPPPAHQASTSGPPAASPAAAYSGPMLGWANKRSPRGEPATTTHAPQPPQALALAHQFARTAPTQRPTPTPTQASVPPTVQPGYEPVVRAPIAPAQAPPDATPALLGGPPLASLPQSLYGPAPAAAPLRQVAAAPSAGGGRTHLYSVHREYGLTPDAIPALPTGDRYVLVGPPDAPPAPEEAADDAEGLDRQF